jgi:hypothetical protein
MRPCVWQHACLILVLADCRAPGRALPGWAQEAAGSAAVDATAAPSTNPVLAASGVVTEQRHVS